MVFSSITFLVYFLPVLLIIYHFTGKKYKNAVLLIASIFFYSWGAPRFIFVILATTLFDFYLVNAIDRSTNSARRKIILILSVCMNLGLLFYFKYCNFFIDNANAILSSMNVKPLKLLNFVLPIGISFYTFESLTYVIDVYRKIHKPLKNFWDYQLYIILFPKLIAGPIIRYHEIADQISDRSSYDNADNELLGFFRFTIGLSKKVFIANTLAVYADDVFYISPQLLNTTTAWLGTLSYCFQIYFDFSGYSDMAIGLGRMFGFKFPENFNNPYISQNITEFWRRWHISLGKWMKNYLYIPLGGNRVATKNKLYFNLWLVFLVSGLWHGASWTFILWGAYHGTFLVLERIFLIEILKKTGKIFSTLFTFLITSVGWVIFRADSPKQAFLIISKLFSFDFSTPIFHLNTQYIFYLILAIIFSFFASVKLGERTQANIFFSDRTLKGNLFYSLLSCFLFTLAIAAIAATDFNPFIYFRF